MLSFCLHNTVKTILSIFLNILYLLGQKISCGVAGAVLQTALSFSNSWFVEIYSKQYNSQTVRARELTFGENVHPTTCVMRPLSRVMCHMSHFTCHVAHLFF